MPEYKKICGVCGKEFVTERGNTKYCSPECKYIAIKRRYIGYPHHCKKCGAELPIGSLNYCDPCMFDVYYQTNDQAAYRALVRRGYGGRLTMEQLTQKKHKIK